MNYRTHTIYLPEVTSDGKAPEKGRVQAAFIVFPKDGGMESPRAMVLKGEVANKRDGDRRGAGFGAYGNDWRVQFRPAEMRSALKDSGVKNGEQLEAYAALSFDGGKSYSIPNRQLPIALEMA